MKEKQCWMQPLLFRHTYNIAPSRESELMNDFAIQTPTKAALLFPWAKWGKRRRHKHSHIHRAAKTKREFQKKMQR
jgi:hypothetical protein